MLTKLYSLLLEICAQEEAILPASLGNQTHALFLNLISQIDLDLAARLHDEPNYRPFTVSSLKGIEQQGQKITVKVGQTCFFRVTLLDGGEIWRSLSRCFLEARKRKVVLGGASFEVLRLISTPEADTTGWALSTDWQSLATVPQIGALTIHFTSPTAFSLGNRHFAFYPEPILVWDSLLRSWNLYAPEVLRMDKERIREAVKTSIFITDHSLKTATVQYPKYPQKGFIGRCRYQIQESEIAQWIGALAGLAHYSGIGYKTTMGMGQVRVKIERAE